MKCPQCEREGKRSMVTVNRGQTTLAGSQPYYDEDGAYHHHNPNASHTSYLCSNHHRWTRVSYAACPACAWTVRSSIGKLKEPVVFSGNITQTYTSRPHPSGGWTKFVPPPNYASEE